MNVYIWSKSIEVDEIFPNTREYNSTQHKWKKNWGIWSNLEVIKK